MVTIGFFIFAAVSFHFDSILGLKQLPPISSPTEFINSVIDQIDVDDAKLQEFLPIFHYFVNFTALEKRSREEVNTLTETDFIENDVNEQLYGSYSWQDAIDEALYEEDNVTRQLNESYEDVVDYINKFISKPENFKEIYIQSLDRDKDEDVHTNDTSAANETSHDARDEDVNEYWDATDTLETRRIFRGNKTKIKLYPFMASVHLFDEFACAGSIISADLVITAASCLQLLWNNRFFRENPAFVAVRIGTTYFSVGGEKIVVQEVYFYPTYNPRTLQNNLALMRLRRRIKFKRKRVSNVKKITFDTKASALSFHTPGITIIGWGAKVKSNFISPGTLSWLHMAVLPYYDLRSCKDIYGSNFITKTNFCAGFITKGYGACNHDVGDPGVVGGTLMGITSFGSPICGQDDTPTVFTKVGYYADWIESIMEQKVPKAKVRTTTKPTPTLIPLQLLGIDHDEDKPVPPPLREQKFHAVSNQKIQPIIDENLIKSNQKLGIEPIMDTEEFEAALVVREGHHSEHSEKDTVKSSQEGDKIGESSDDVNYFDIATARPGLRVTKIIDDPPEDSVSKEDNKHAEEEESESSESAKTSESIEIGYDGPVVPNAAVTMMPDTNIDMKEYMWTESPSADEKDKDSPFESDHERHRTTKINVRDFTVMEEKEHLSSKVDKEYDDEATLRDEKGINNKHHSVSPVIYEDSLTKVRSAEEEQDDNDNIPRKHRHESQDVHNVQVDEATLRDEKGIKNKHHSVSPVSYEDSFTKVRSAEEEQDDNDNIPRKHRHESQDAHNVQVDEQSRAEVAAEVSEDMIKREIEKLIRDLDVVSSEVSAHYSSNNSKDTLDDDNRLTLLYLSDSEKKIKPRTGYDDEGVSDNEGLSIDAKPFKANAKIRDDLVGDLIGEKEVFEIFADVIDSMVNKTLKSL